MCGGCGLVLDLDDDDAGLPVDGGSFDAFTDADGQTEAGQADARPVDAQADSWPTGPFGAPRLVEALGSPARDDDPTFTADLLELYFASERSGNEDIWRSQRASPSDPWDSPVPVPVLNSPFRDSDPAIAADGQTIWFVSQRPGGVGTDDVWVATRSTDGWNPPTVVLELRSPANTSASPVASGEAILMLASDQTGDFDLFQTQKVDGDGGSRWSTVITRFPSLAGPGGAIDAAPCSPDGLHIVFFSSRSGFMDLYQAERRSLDGAFSAPTRIDELTTPGEESAIETPTATVQTDVRAAATVPCRFETDCGEGMSCRQWGQYGNVCMGFGGSGDPCWFDGDCLGEPRTSARQRGQHLFRMSLRIDLREHV
jgi:hypothetical protein